MPLFLDDTGIYGNTGKTLPAPAPQGIALGASSVVQFGNGTAAAPSMSFTNSTTTGLFRRAADSVGFSTVGLEIGSFTSAGAWTFGPNTGVVDLIHTLKSGGNTRIDLIGGAGNTARLRFFDGSTRRAAIDTNGANVLRFLNSSENDVFGQMDTATGVWTLGPASNSSIAHRFNGSAVEFLNHNGSSRLDLLNNGNGSNLVQDALISAIQFSGRFNGTNNDLASINAFYRGNGTTRSGSIAFNTYLAGVSNVAGAIAESGAWTLGPGAGMEIPHTIRSRSTDFPILAGSQGSGVSIGASGTGFPSISWNARPGTTSPNFTRVVTNTSSILYLGQGPSGFTGFEFHSFVSGGAGTLTTGGLSFVGGVQSDGTWTFGRAGITSPSGTLDHTFHAGASTDNRVRVISNTTSATSNGYFEALNGGGNAARFGSVGGAGAFFPNTVVNDAVIQSTINGVSVSGATGPGARMASNGNSFVAISDIRHKKNILPISYGLHEILQISSISYDYNTDIANLSHRLGFGAQQIESLIPALVNNENPNMKMLDYQSLIPVLVKAIQELKQELENLKAEVRGT